MRTLLLVAVLTTAAVRGLSLNPAGKVPPALLNVSRQLHQLRFPNQRAAAGWPDDAGSVDAAAAAQLFAEGFAFEATDDATLRAAASMRKAAVWAEAAGAAWHIHGPAGNAPQQVHIAPTATQGNVSVVWLTDDSSIASEVQWRQVGGGAPVTVAAGSSWTYDPISVFAWRGRVHGAFLLDIRPGTAYEYRVGDPTARNCTSTVGAAASSGTVGCFSQWFSLRMADRDADHTYVALGGDMGSVQLFGFAVAKQMLGVNAQRAFDAFWHLGDITYSTVSPPRFNFEFFADWYGIQEEALAAHVPMLVTYGNHDVSGGDCGAFIHRYRNPRPTPQDGPFNFYWSYRQGPIHYVSMCTETGDNYNHTLCQFHPGADQYKWLERELAGVNRSVTPWVVVAGHRPMYSTDSEHTDRLQPYVETLFVRYGVDVYIAGHMHETEVTSPMKNFTAQDMDRVSVAVDAHGATNMRMRNTTAPVHVTVGTMGAVQGEFFKDPRPDWSLFRNGTLWDDAYGFATLEATRTALNFTFLRQRTGTALWRLSIEK